MEQMESEYHEINMKLIRIICKISLKNVFFRIILISSLYI